MPFEDIYENVEMYNCDRCGKARHVNELVEDIATPGLFVCPETCADKLGFNEMKADSPRDSYNHYFK